MSQGLSSPNSLDDALDSVPAGGGVVRVDRGNAEAEVEVIDVDRLGVKLRGVRINRGTPVDIAEEARALPERLRSLPDRIEPIAWPVEEFALVRSQTSPSGSHYEVLRRWRICTNAGAN